MKTYGLIGKNIAYSFSRQYFTEKFEREHISAEYKNFDLQDLSSLRKILDENVEIEGLNVTIPYKQDIIAYLDSLDPVAAEIGAVNTIKVEKSGRLTGYNTDHYGFRESLKPHLGPQHTHALILGTGGASKAVAYSLEQLEIAYSFVSRTPAPGQLHYTHLEAAHFEKYRLIVNCTPLGTSPQVSSYPPLPAQHLGPQHFIYDLIYNPPVTRLMQLGLERGAGVLNGRQMLELQAEKAWQIWNAVH